MMHCNILKFIIFLIQIAKNGQSKHNRLNSKREGKDRAVNCAILKKNNNHNKNLYQAMLDWDRNIIALVVTVVCVILTITWVFVKKDDNVLVQEGWTKQMCDVKRMQEIVRMFGKKFEGSKPEFMVRSPGRVNIIGEHIDYCGYSVFPMAINKDIMFAVSLQRVTGETAKKQNGGVFRLSNKDKAFEDITLNWQELCKMDRAKLLTEKHWSKYVIAACVGVIDIVSKRAQDDSMTEFFATTDLNVLVHGVLAKGAGLSSSAALICGSVVLLLYVLDQLKNLTRTDIAKLCMECERYVGVNTGGMDQSIVMTGRRNFAKYVSFVPHLDTADVLLPQSKNEPYVFVICNSLAEHQLTDDLGTRNYNMRVIECRLAAVVLAKALKLKDWSTVQTLRDVQDRLFQAGHKNCNHNHDISNEEMCSQLSGLLFKCMNLLDSEPYTLEQIEQELFDNDNDNDNANDKEEKQDDAKLDAKLSQLFLAGLKRADDVVAKIRQHKFKLLLQQRALHVYSEALRVVQFRKLCEQHLESHNDNVVAHMSDLMNKSHLSCKEQYDCSAEQLELLRNVCLEGGASACRLTGAGWGGCVIGIVKCNKLQDFKEHVQKHFYANFPSVPLDAMFETSPADGVCIFKTEDFAKHIS
ncbi:hypothetical protein RFI_22850 [Reticulomyxa filosa]|uniref:Galactokinase n=1 Tax=Reticulomyxa filosa TaxID=46433 RepID=X6MN49_RETFI|nr:hypothetical protein RFI_22850 [Reticulomyxa filosa]|eukprot:ETO14520.1 hypothetical protein RFI_22850 [Reticulomyxa filosa]